MRRFPQGNIGGLLFGCALNALARLACAEVMVVVPEYSEQYASLAHSIIQAAPGSAGQLRLYTDLPPSLDDYELVVTIGNEATHAVNHDKRFRYLPVLSGFIPRSEYRAGPLRSAVFSDINPAIHVKLIKQMYPGREPRIGVFVDSETDYLFGRDLPDKIGGFSLVQKELNEAENPAQLIARFVEDNNLDAFIVIPSSIIYDPHSLKAMLYSLYQLKVPAIAYTPRLVEGGVGCVVAAYFDKDLVLSEMVNRIHSFYETGELSTTTSTPTKAKVVVNLKLAEAFQLDLRNLMKYGEIHEQ